MQLLLNIKQRELMKYDNKAQVRVLNVYESSKKPDNTFVEFEVLRSRSIQLLRVINFNKRYGR